MGDPYANDEYVIRRKVFTLFGAKFQCDGRVVIYFDGLSFHAGMVP